MLWKHLTSSFKLRFEIFEVRRAKIRSRPSDHPKNITVVRSLKKTSSVISSEENLGRLIQSVSLRFEISEVWRDKTNPRLSDHPK
jgi:hypothetical protein